jgi:hypothetical protein
LISTAAAAEFSAPSLRRLSHNECRRWLLTKRSWARILFAEPLIFTASREAFWLTGWRRELARIGQYWGKRALSESGPTTYGLAERGSRSPLWGPILSLSA